MANHSFIWPIVTALVTLAGCSSSALETAYRRQSIDTLDRYFQTWHESIVPISDEELIHAEEVEQATYAVYEQTFSPFDYPSIGGDSLTAMKYRYVVIQGTVPYIIVDSSSLKMIRKGSVDHFRPRVPRIKGITIPLTPEHESELNAFLDRGEERVSFLQHYMYVLHQHWGKGWHIATPPVITRLQFNQTFLSARVWFRVGYEFGQASLTKQGGLWILSNAEIDAIE
ncbi:MAG: hypothetical protein ABIQ57_18275 [Candidatus Kapaibacterium sp.]